jgi:hypothetical protein
MKERPQPRSKVRWKQEENADDSAQAFRLTLAKHLVKRLAFGAGSGTRSTVLGVNEKAQIKNGVSETNLKQSE